MAFWYVLAFFSIRSFIVIVDVSTVGECTILYESLIKIWWQICGKWTCEKERESKLRYSKHVKTNKWKHHRLLCTEKKKLLFLVHFILLYGARSRKRPSRIICLDSWHCFSGGFRRIHFNDNLWHEMILFNHFCRKIFINFFIKCVQIDHRWSHSSIHQTIRQKIAEEKGVMKNIKLNFFSG